MEFLAIGLLATLGWLLRKPAGQETFNTRPYWAFLVIVAVIGQLAKLAR